MLAADGNRLAQFQRARDSGELASLMAGSSIRAMVAIGEAVEAGQVDLAKAMLDSRPPSSGGDAFSALAEMLRYMPEPESGGPSFLDRPDSDLQIVERPGAEGVLFVFCGHAHRVGVPLNLLHRWLAPLAMHIVYLRDFRRLFYLGGVASVAGGLAALPGRLHRIADNLGATRIATLGSSGGAYATLRVGAAIGASAMLSLGGPTTLERVGREIRKRAAAASLDADELVGLAMSLPLPGGNDWPPTRLVFAGDNEVDRWQAERMQNVPGVELWPIEGWPHHSTMGPLARSGMLTGHLAWLAGRNGTRRPAPHIQRVDDVASAESLIPLDSKEGEALLRRSGGATYEALRVALVPQLEPGYCGIASVLTVLRASGLAPDFAGASATPEIGSFFDGIGVPNLLGIARRRGLTLAQVLSLLPANRVPAEMHLVTEVDLRAFRRMAREWIEHPGRFVIANYERRRLGQTGSGHHSPLAAYDQKSDRFLIYDVIPDREPPVWAKAKQLFAAMKAKSRTRSGGSRGFILVGSPTNGHSG